MDKYEGYLWFAPVDVTDIHGDCNVTGRHVGHVLLPIAIALHHLYTFTASLIGMGDVGDYFILKVKDSPTQYKE